LSVQYSVNTTRKNRRRSNKIPSPWGLMSFLVLPAFLFKAGDRVTRAALGQEPAAVPRGLAPAGKSLK
jgi:hypothetical protein